MSRQIPPGTYTEEPGKGMGSIIIMIRRRIKRSSWMIIRDCTWKRRGLVQNE
jgi:hypothetical protein